MEASEELVKSNIRKYFNWQDLDNLLNIVNNLSFLEFEKYLCQLLKSPDREIVYETCFAIRDIIVSYSNRYDEFIEFGKIYPESLIVKTVENLLFSGNRNIVLDAIYTLGKTYCYSSIPVLNKAFYHHKDTDPFILSRLLFEMTWLGLENFWELIDSMISSHNDFTRWAAVQQLPVFVDEDCEKSILLDDNLKYLERLKQDSNKFVRIEAEHRYKMIEFQTVEQDLPKKERNKKRKELENQYKSILNFESLSTSFTSYLYYKKMNNCTLSQLEEFFDYYIYFKGFYRLT
ncbi:MAG: hypothetical protein MJK14_15700 [Rivularia sp. ALOHA_DT_140]|nr:hypothetical protein [Rivularia sp. ALOHA_DT_140]